MALRNALVQTNNSTFWRTVGDHASSKAGTLMQRSSVNGIKLAQCQCSSAPPSSHGYSIEKIVPPQDAFALRHLGPRKDEREEMCKVIGIKVRRPRKPRSLEVKTFVICLYFKVNMTFRFCFSFIFRGAVT